MTTLEDLKNKVEDVSCALHDLEQHIKGFGYTVDARERFEIINEDIHALRIAAKHLTKEREGAPCRTGN